MLAVASDTRTLTLTVAGIVGGAIVVAFLRWFVKTRAMDVPRWVWRRLWGRDDHGTYLTPMVRITGLIQRAVEPQHARLRDENLQQHAAVELQLGNVVDGLSHVTGEVQTLQDRVTAIESYIKTQTKEPTP